MGRKTKLNSDLQEQIIELLAIGVPDDAMCQQVGISKSSFYNWLKWGRGYEAGGKNGETITVDEQVIELPKSGKGKFLAFLDAVTRARGTAKVHAIDAIHEAIGGQEQVTTIDEFVSETRLKKDGTEYEYKKRVQKTVTTQQPADWRAAIEYLERRDPDHWSKQQRVNLSGSLQLSDDVVAMLKRMNVDMADVVRKFEDMVRNQQK